MANINDDNFVEHFNVSDMVVGVVGFGYVGKAVEAFFSNQCKTLVYDKFVSDIKLNTLEEVVGESNVIFVSVPTPMNKDGSCNTSIVEEVLSNIMLAANKVGRDTNEFIVVSKSTVPPGFTKAQKEKTKLRLVFSPEFLTEKNSITDFANTNRMLAGGDEIDTTIVLKLFEPKMGATAALIMCDDPTTLELVKLFANGVLATKVMFANEFALVCEKLNVDYTEIMTLACLDKRIGYSHLHVPGHDGYKGFGGSCFVKDLNSLKSTAKKLGTGERLFTTILERNNEIREEKDWEKMIGRVVLDE